MSLIDERYMGRRPQLWEEWTSVEFTITEPPKKEALVQPTPAMPQTPSFGNLDDVFVDVSQRPVLTKLLSEGVVEVVFETSEGNTRSMLCTTLVAAIPEGKRPKAKSKALSLQEIAFEPDPMASLPRATADPNLFKVFVIDLQEWRSFRFERVKSFTKYIV